MCKSGKPGKTTAEIDTASMDSYDVGSTEIKSYLQCIVFVVYVASRTKFKKSARHRGRPVGISPFGAESVAPVPEDRRHSLNGTVSATAAGTDLARDQSCRVWPGRGQREFHVRVGQGQLLPIVCFPRLGRPQRLECATLEGRSL